jgi:hypothetical protein
MMNQNKTVEVKSLEKMEDVVKGHPALSWDGWTVLHFSHRYSFMNKSAAFLNGEWGTVTRFEPEASGWTVPGEFV